MFWFFPKAAEVERTFAGFIPFAAAVPSCRHVKLPLLKQQLLSEEPPNSSTEPHGSSRPTFQLRALLSVPSVGFSPPDTELKFQSDLRTPDQARWETLASLDVLSPTIHLKCLIHLRHSCLLHSPFFNNVTAQWETLSTFAHQYFL